MQTIKYTGRKTWFRVAKLGAIVAIGLANPALAQVTQPAGCDNVLVRQKLIEITPAQHDLGTIPDTQILQFAFKITNRSQQTLKLLHINTPCSCTAAKPEPDEIAPGGMSTIQLTLNPKGKSGQLHWEVGITNNLASDPICLPFEVTVFKDGFLSTEAIYFGEIRRGVTTEKKQIWLSPRSFPNFQLHRAHVEFSDAEPGRQKPDDYFTISWEVASYAGFYPGPRRAYCIQIAPTATIPFGRIEGNLALETDIPGQEKIMLPLTAIIIGEIGMSRDYVSTGIISSKQAVTKRFMIYHREGQPFHILQTHVLLPFLKVSVQPVIPEQYYEISITGKINAQTPHGEFRTKLYIKTSSQELPEIVVPIQGFVQQEKK